MADQRESKRIAIVGGGLVGGIFILDYIFFGKHNSSSTWLNQASLFEAFGPRNFFYNHVDVVHPTSAIL